MGPADLPDAEGKALHRRSCDDLAILCRRKSLPARSVRRRRVSPLSLRPRARETRRAFFRLSAFQEPLARWIADKGHWRLPVVTFTKAWLQEGLQDRPLTRDIDWGIRVPLTPPERGGARVYVG